VPEARDRRASEGRPGVALRATRGTAIISLTHAWLYELNMNDLICSAKYSSYSLVPFLNRP
jgi:hypothetical protein